MIRCLHCGAETNNGLALCERCRYKASIDLEFIPVYFRNLARQRRPGRPNGSLGSASGWLMRHGETDGSKIAPALERTVNDLGTWAIALNDDRNVELPTMDAEPETIATVCALLDENLTSISTLEWAGQFLRDLDKHERNLRALTETTVPGWYAGTCRQVTGRTMEGDEFVCGTSTYVVPGLTWITCGGCGVVTYARDHLDIVLEEARGWVAPPMRLAEALVALIDTEQSTVRLYERIKKWGQRDKVSTLRRLDADGDEVGPKRHRLGEVLDLIRSEGATRTDQTNAPKSAKAS